MKKIFYKIAVLALVITSATSCDDKLDQDPFDELGTENAYVSPLDFENGIRGVYRALAYEEFYGGSDGGGMLDMPDVLSDNVTLAQKGRKSRQQYHNFRYSPAAAALSGMYQRAYQLIFRANTLLSKAESFDGESKANVVAEAKALRALAHLDLVSFFGKIPTQSGDANGSLGIAYVTDPDPQAQPTRETVGAVYAKIVTDLKEAAADINETNGVGRMGKDGVNTILSRVYLNMGEWQKAADAASAVTTAIASGDDFTNIWIDESRDGLLLYIPVNPPILKLVILGTMWNQGSLSSLTPEYVASYELFQLYKDDDIRKEAYIAEGKNGSLKFNAIIKYFGRPGGASGEVDIKILRAAESRLNKAEALYNLGQEGPARNALDAVRSKRYTTPPSGETGTALRDAIRLERRLEFAFEAQRFFDLKRWGVAVDREAFGDLSDGSGTPDDVLTLEAGSTKFQMPLPQGALDANPNLVQNPGY